MANTTADRSGQPRDGTVGALLHGLAVLDMFSRDRPVIGIGEVSRQLGVHRSTASRLAATLATAGYLEPAGEQGRYRLAAKLSLLGALLVLALSGLLTLVVRNTAAFGAVLYVHLAAVAACFAIAPYTKFMHVIYRFLALVRHNSELGQR